MTGDLSPLRGSSLEPGFGHRLSYRDRQIVKDALTEGVRVRGIGYVAARAMSEVANLDDRRRFLAAGDPALNTLLVDIELTAAASIRAVQEGLYG